MLHVEDCVREVANTFSFEKDVSFFTCSTVCPSLLEYRYLSNFAFLDYRQQD